jgi:hypothetical protein
MKPFIRGFANELTKLAGPLEFLERLKKSPELRHAIRRSTMLGAATGAIGGALQHKDKGESRAKKMLGAGALGALGGAISGASFPGWFSEHAMRAHGEV